MGELCKECFKKCMNPNATDDFLIMSETFDMCERCNNFGPIVLGEGVIDKLGGWHIDGIGINPLGNECGECHRLTCEGCPSVCTYNQWVYCNECIDIESCKTKKDKKGCYDGNTKYHTYYHIRPKNDGCVVLAYDTKDKKIYKQNKAYSTEDALIFPTEQAAKQWIQYSNILNPIEKYKYMPEYFWTAIKRTEFAQIILKEEID